MVSTGGGPDYINIDGGEGGTGAAPLAFSDHVALPFKIGFSRVYSKFAEAGLAEDVVFIEPGVLVFRMRRSSRSLSGATWSASGGRR